MLSRVRHRRPLLTNVSSGVDFIYLWNSTFPFDLWWRRRYQIPFGDSRHLSMNIIDIWLEFVEFKITLEQYNKQNEYIKGSGDIFTAVNYSDKDLKEMFNNLRVED